MSVFESAAACPLSTQNDPSSVRILRPSAKVSPEPIIPTLVSEPELAPRCVFGVALETLREDGQMVCGIPLVLRDMVQFLDKNGNLGSSLLHFFCHSSAILSLFLFYASHRPLFLLLSQCTTVLTILTESFCLLAPGMQHRGLFRLCGSVVRTKQLRQRWDSGERVDLEHEQDVPTVTSVLKLFFRELPTPLVPEPQRKQLVLSLTGTRKCIKISNWTGVVFFAKFH